jgi:hypothetical protein
MKLNYGLHLAYTTNVHRGESWAEVFHSLEQYTLAIRRLVCPQEPYAIGLRLSERAAVELSEPAERLIFKRWLDQHNCYIFTLNGFPYGHFHGTKIKEQAYRPDWTSPERVAYTNLLFNLLAELLPAGIEGSVSTLPVSFKEFRLSTEALKTARQNLWRTVEHIARVSEKTGRKLSLGLEPEPLCHLESSAETLHLFEHLRAEHPRDERLANHLGVNYDTCHFAVNYEDPQSALACLVNNGIKISKIHLSSALQTRPTPEARLKLTELSDDIFLHQVVERDPAGQRTIYRDLPDALGLASRLFAGDNTDLPEWRIHFHIPMHAAPAAPLENTTSHILGILDLLASYPEICTHLEMETYTWEVLPPGLKSRPLVEQISEEYAWVIAQLRQRGLV